MEVSKIIRGIVNSRGYTITSAITQWDYGYVFVPEFEDLPATYRLDFSNDEHHGTALPVYCGSEGGEVPEELIDTGKDIFVWFFYIGDGFGKSEYKWRIPNKCKPKTEQDEPTPSQQSSIDQAIAVVNDAVETVEQKAEEADTSARNAKEDADRAEQARDDAQTAQRKAEEAQESSERAKDDAQTSERNASESERKAKGYADTASEKADAITGLTATATTLPDGSSATASYDAETGVMSFGIPKGKDGTDGDDGYSPTANVSKTGKVATITITDKNGTTSAQVEDGEDGTDGIDGISPSVSVTDITGGHRVVITDKDGTEFFDVEDGATGATPNLTIGIVETLEPTESATASITGTPENPVLNLGIPQGEQGEVTLEDYYKAFPTDTASGSIASFSDGADDLPLKSLVVDINPIQDLHGQDSPYPAGGGVNKLDLTACTLTDCVFVSASAGSVRLNMESKYMARATLAKADFPAGLESKILNGESFTFEVDNNDNKTITIVINGTRSDSSTLEEFNGGRNLVTATPTLFTAVTSIQFRFRRQGTTYTDTTSVVTGLRLSYGSTATTFTPYENICPISGWTQVNINHSDADTSNPTTLTIDLGQTVYGGKLDVLSGELVIDRAMVDLGTPKWIYNTTYAFFTTNSLTDRKKGVVNLISDLFKTKAGSWDGTPKANALWGNGSNQTVYVQYPITSVEDFMTLITGHQLCYELAEPIEIQLSANQINSLLGVNNIWADSGDTEAEYRADTKLYISKKIAEAISALS